MTQTREDISLRHVLLTNDDGFDAPGLAAMYAALEGLARLSVVAPIRPVSSVGHGVTDRGTIRVERRHVEPLGRIHVVDGTPADCVRLGLIELLGHRPDWVVAGINRGGNLGADVFYSGTVAAAREAAIPRRPRGGRLAIRPGRRARLAPSRWLDSHDLAAHSQRAARQAAPHLERQPAGALAD